MSEALAREMDRAFHHQRKKNPYEAHASAIISMVSVAFSEQDETDVLKFLGSRHAAALFAETFDDAIRTNKDRFLMPSGMEKARDRLMAIAGVHHDGNGEYCQRDDGEWSAMIGSECPRCGYQKGDQ